MKQNAGLIAVVTVVLAFFGLTNLPKNTPSGGAVSEATNKSKSPAKSNENKAPTLSPACEEIGSRLEPFLANKLVPRKIKNANDRQYPSPCYDGDDKRQPNARRSPPSPDLHFVIATVPNPISTHLPLMFDRMIEVIEQAAQDDNYSYDSSWFPWDESSKDYTSFVDQVWAAKALERQQGQPGVVVFRRSVDEKATDDAPYRSGLVVFVIAEQPTRGIDREEFDNALAWIEWLGGLSPARPLKILGPSFSGSLPSLDQSLDSEKLKQIPVSISSGTISSQSSYVWFQNRIRRNPLLTFQTAMEGDPLMVDRLLSYLNGQGYPLGQVAIISEDETAFGTQEGRDNRDGDKNRNKTPSEPKPKEQNRPTHLYYPRDIATLRSAYVQQSVFSTGKQPSNGTAAATTLRGDLSEPNSSNHDTVRSYGGQLTPLAQESVLLGIVKILKEKQIQFVVLRSTNPLDQIFLAQFFKRAYPAGRIVIDGADLLFTRGDEGSSLRGVMTLSTYPLLTWQQDWTPTLMHRGAESYRIFGEDIAEGLYIAARGTFDDPTSRSGVPIGNYAPPAWLPTSGADNPRPATWLSVIGQHQFWPVAVLPQYPIGDSTALELVPTALNQKVHPADAPATQPMRIPIELTVLVIGCLVWTGLHWLWCRNGSISPFRSYFQLAHFAPLGAKQHPALIAFGSLLPAGVAVVTAATCGLFGWGSRSLFGPSLGVWLLGILATSFLACVENFRLPDLSGKPSASWQRWVGAVSLAALALFILGHYDIVRGMSGENRIPAHWRNAHVFNGVSALLPQLILMAGMYLWFWFSLRGLALFGDDRPLLPNLDSLPKDSLNGSRMPMFSREWASEPTEKEAIPAGAKYLRRLVPLLLATGFVFSVALQDYTLRTIGERKFGTMMYLWLCLCMAIVLADAGQMWTTWRNLRRLLVYLDRLPLRRTLTSLPGLSWKSVWTVSGNTLEERYRLISRQLESLTHLYNLLKDRSEQNSPEENKLLRELKQCREIEVSSFVAWYVRPDNRFENVKPLQSFQNELAAIAGSVMTNVLLPAWQEEKGSLILDRTHGGSQSNDKKGEADDAAPAAAPSNLSPYVQVAEEFFVLPYLGFIQNILGRMRTITLGSLCLFVAATFAVSSYPFDPLPVLGGIFLAIFSITGCTLIVIFAQMHRDATLSLITNTQPGELGSQFWMHLITFGVGPLLGLLTTLFPSITDFVTAWLQPGTHALQ